MATPRRREPKRDKPGTMRKFVLAVGRLLTRFGFSGLKVEKIASEAGHDSSLITRYFGSMAGLQRTYIMEIDYWVPFFERFTLSPGADIAEIRTMFTALFKENFRGFLSNVEFQNIILWQISEDNELMREISDGREARGELLFKNTDPSFAGSGVNFRAFSGLLLGGIYYMVLQARSIKGAVCGIDLNKESDQLEVLQTLEQMIGWACDAAVNHENKINDSRYMINYDFELLENLAGQLSEKAAAEPDAQVDVLLKSEIRKLTKLIPQHLLTLSNDTQIESFLKLTLNRLSDICDVLYVPGHGLNVNAQEVVTLMSSVFKHFADKIPASVVMPKLFGFQASAENNLRWQGIKAKLEAIGTDPFLIDAIYLPFGKFIHAGAAVCWSEYQYLKVYGKTLEEELASGVKDQASLMDLLIGLGHNHPRFYFFYTGTLKDAMADLGESGRRNILLEAKTRIGQIVSWTSMSFVPVKIAVVDELSKWIDLELARTPVLAESELNKGSLITLFNATQLAVWRKLEYDAGIYLEANLDVFSEKVALNFMTKGGVRLSQFSVKSKLYSKEAAVFKFLEAYALKMLEEIRRFL